MNSSTEIGAQAAGSRCWGHSLGPSWGPDTMWPGMGGASATAGQMAPPAASANKARGDLHVLLETPTEAPLEKPWAGAYLRDTRGPDSWEPVSQPGRLSHGGGVGAWRLCQIWSVLLGGGEVDHCTFLSLLPCVWAAVKSVAKHLQAP